MIVNGVEVSPAAEQTLETWMRTHKGKVGFRSSNLVDRVKALDVPSLTDAVVSMRVADRMINLISGLIAVIWRGQSVRAWRRVKHHPSAPWWTPGNWNRR